MIDLLPSDHLLKLELEPLGRFSPYAIAFRYPTLDPDVLPDPPTRNDILGWLDELVKAKAVVAAAIVTET